MGWVDDAISIYTDILRKSPNDTEVLTALGIISSNLDQGSEARIFFSKLLELEPWNHEARAFIAELDTADATPKAATAPSMTDSSQVTSPDLDAILADLRDTITRLDQKNQPNDMYANALALLNQGDEPGATRELEKLVQSQPSHALAHNDLGVLYQRHGVLQKALHHHELAVKQDPTNATFKKNLAGLYFAELERNDDAIFLLTEVLRTNQNDVETLMGLARIALTIGQTDEASIFIGKVTELEPWNEDARELSGQINGNNSFFLASR